MKDHRGGSFSVLSSTEGHWTLDGHEQGTTAFLPLQGDAGELPSHAESFVFPTSQQGLSGQTDCKGLRVACLTSRSLRAATS